MMRVMGNDGGGCRMDNGVMGNDVAGAGWMRAMGNDGGRMDGGDGMIGVGLRSGGV